MNTPAHELDAAEIESISHEYMDILHIYFTDGSRASLTLPQLRALRRGEGVQKAAPHAISLVFPAA
jgi:hypothetical protein